MHSRNTLLDDEEKARLKVIGAGEPRVIKSNPFLSSDAKAFWRGTGQVQ